MTRNVRIREVWAYNVEQEIIILSDLLDHYDHIAIDTEFPGVIMRPVDSKAPDLSYQTLRGNVDVLNVIQMGLTLSNKHGESPQDATTWQFNFSFSLRNDLYAEDSIDLLKKSGINFAAHDRDGIDVERFGEMLYTSGLICNARLTWICFHGGYDFGYFVKILTSVDLPQTEDAFFVLLRVLFPNLYDLKYIIMHTDTLYGGLNKIGELLGCERFGAMHQAGSDSLLTLDAFLRIRDSLFEGAIDEAHIGTLFGLGMQAKASSARAISIVHDKGVSASDQASNGKAEPPPPAGLTAA